MDKIIENIDNGKAFDFGKVSKDYAAYRDIYPQSLYQKLLTFGIGLKGQRILDVGTGTGVIPRHMCKYGAEFTGTDISENQIRQAEALSEGLPIKYKVCPAEQTSLQSGYFDAVIACQCFHYLDVCKFIPELQRILKKEGKFCKVFMEWLPFEDEMLFEMEKLILKYNPDWNGGGYKKFEFKMPDWANGVFEIDTIHSYKEILTFTTDSWCGRIRTCRGIGASLPQNKIDQFEKEHMNLLNQYSKNGLLNIPHEIKIEIYRLA